MKRQEISKIATNYFHQGNLEQALCVLASLAEKYPKAQLENFRLSKLPKRAKDGFSLLNAHPKPAAHPWSGAIEPAISKVTLNPANKNDWLELARIAAARKHRTVAGIAYVEAALIDGKDKSLLREALDYLLNARRLDDAFQLCRFALIKHPSDDFFNNFLGVLYSERGMFKLSVPFFRKALRYAPHATSIRLNLVNSLAEADLISDAIEELIAAFSHDPKNPKIQGMIASLPPGLANEKLLSDLEHAASERLSLPVTADDYFLLAHLEKHKNNLRASFSNLKTANDLYLKCIPDYDLKLAEEEQALAATLTAVEAWNPCPKRETEDSPRLIFILGPSRSGKTTCDRLVAKYFDLERAHEACRLGDRINELHSCSLSDQLPALDISDISYLSNSDYRERQLKGISFTSPYAISKVHLISDLFPQAKFIFMDRDDFDTGAEIYLKKYRSKNFYAYSLKSITQHLKSYRRISDVLLHKLKHRAMLISYDKLLSDPLGELAGLEDFLGISGQLNPDATHEKARFSRSIFSEEFELHARQFIESIE